MKYSNMWKREVEVAFSKHAQPLWFRILKYILLIIFIYYFHANTNFWRILIGFIAFSLALHFWYRYKTNAWTKSYGGWNYEKNKSKLPPK